MSVLATQTNETSDFFYNEAFDPSLPMAISRILNYVASVHTYSYRSRRIKLRTKHNVQISCAYDQMRITSKIILTDKNL